MNDTARVRAQLGADLRVFRRNPAALFFTALLPVIFLCLFVGIFGNDRLRQYDDVRAATLQVPAFMALAVISASFVALAIGFTRTRESGVLKRARATPVAPWILITGRIGTSIVTTVVITALLMAIGKLAFDVALPTHTLPAMLVTLALGTATFCALGIAFSRAIPTEDAAPAMTNAIVLPLYFISGVFVPFRQLPEGLRKVAEVLPAQPFVEALRVTFDPHTTGAGFSGTNLLKLAIWLVVGVVLAVRFFLWTPRDQAG